MSCSSTIEEYKSSQSVDRGLVEEPTYNLLASRSTSFEESFLDVFLLEDEPRGHLRCRGNIL